MMEDNLLIPDVDVKPAPSLPLLTETRHNNKSLHWRKVFLAQIRQVISEYKTIGRTPKVKEVVALFPSEDKEHQWPDGPPIKTRRRIWVQECRKLLGKKSG